MGDQMDVNYDLYRVFCQVARWSSFSRAAEQLHLTQSAVSQSIKNLESQLGVTLFFRRTRQVLLTDEGQLLLAHVEQAINYLKIAENKILEVKNLEAGQLHIGASDTLTRYFLLPRLEQFVRTYPGVTLRLINRTSAQLLELMRKGAIDLALVTAPLTLSGFREEGCWEIEDLFVAAPGFSKLRKRTVSLQELASQPLILLEKGSATRKGLDTYFEKRKVLLNPKIEVESVELLAELARRGLGIAHLPRECVRTDLQRGTLFEVHTETALPRRSIKLVTLPNVPLSQTSQRLLEMLKG
jgi:DNA-binding transcriptional LysR family regulator